MERKDLEEEIRLLIFERNRYFGRDKKLRPYLLQISDAVDILQAEYHNRYHKFYKPKHL